MSESAIRWARARCTDPDAPRLTEGERFLLLWLATYHSEIEDAWPTVAALANLMGVSDRRIQQLLTTLEAKGCLTRNTRGGRGHATTYTLPLPLKGEMGEAQSTPFMEETKGERVKSGDVKGEIQKGERVKSAVPDGEPKGGELPGSTPSSSLPSLPFPTVTPETPETTTAAAAGAQALVSVLTGEPGFTPSPAFVAKLAKKYGHLDLEEEAIKMAGWLALERERDKKRPKPKNRQCSPGFVLNWLGRDHEPQEGRSNGRTAAPATGGHQPRAPSAGDSELARWLNGSG